MSREFKSLEELAQEARENDIILLKVSRGETDGAGFGYVVGIFSPPKGLMSACDNPRTCYFIDFEKRRLTVKDEQHFEKQAFPRILGYKIMGNVDG